MKDGDKQVEEVKTTEVVRDKKKAVLFINLHYFGLSLGFLLSKFLYILNPKLQPTEIIFMRSVVGLVALTLYLRSKMKAVVWDTMP